MNLILLLTGKNGSEMVISGESAFVYGIHPSRESGLLMVYYTVNESLDTRNELSMVITWFQYFFNNSFDGLFLGRKLVREEAKEK